MPWNSTRVSLYSTLFPQITDWLPEGGAQLRFEFETTPTLPAARGEGELVRREIVMRSLLFVPADSAKKLDKAMTSGADALIVDLEDSIALDGKARARQSAAAFLKEARRGHTAALSPRAGQRARNRPHRRRPRCRRAGAA